MKSRMMRLFYSFILCFAALQGALAMDLREVRQEIGELVNSFPGEVGVCMISDKGDTVCIDEHRHFALLSVVKFHQSLAVCDRCSIKRLSLDKKIRVRKKDLMPDTWSPMREKNPKGGKYSIAELMKLSLIESDNNACDILFNKLVGVEETNAYIQSLEINDCAISVDEKEMRKDMSSCYNNWSTPMAAAELMEWFYANRGSNEYMEFTWNTMSECQTGTNRIPRFLDGATVVHKTGTGPMLADGKIMAVNDVACVVLPNNHHYNLAVFVQNAKCSMVDCEALIAEISRICYRWYCKSQTSNP